MVFHKHYSRFVPFYFQKRKGVLIENKQTIPFIVRYVKKDWEHIFFYLWVYPDSNEKSKYDITIKWDQVKFNVDLTEIKDEKRVLNFLKN